MHLDWSTLQQISGVAAGFATFLVTMYGLSQRENIKVVWKRREQLIAERNVAISQAADFLRQANVSKALADLYERDLAEVRKRQEEIEKDVIGLKAQVEDSKVLQAKIDAFFDWVQQILDYEVEIFSRAEKAGATLKDLKFPPVPKILADKFNVPETLR